VRFVRGIGARKRVFLGEYLGRIAGKAWALANDFRYLHALFADGRAPTALAALGLQVPFEQMRQQDLQTVADFSAIAPSQALDLLGKIVAVERIKAAVSQKGSLLGAPQGVVLLVGCQV